MALVLNGDVDLRPDGTATVASQRNGATESFAVNGSCSCPDFATAPSGRCLHRLSAAIAKRAYPLAKAKLEAAAGASVSTPSSPAAEVLQAQPTASTDIAPQFIVDIQGKPFASSPVYWHWRTRGGW